MLILLTLDVTNSQPLTRNRDGSIGKLFPLPTLSNKAIPGAVTQTINIIRDCRNNNRAARGVGFLKWEYFISVAILITHDLFLWLKIFRVFIHQYFRQEMCLHDAWWGSCHWQIWRWVINWWCLVFIHSPESPVRGSAALEYWIAEPWIVGPVIGGHRIMAL